MQIINPPDALPLHRINGVIPHSIFLAGSIEQGKAVDWQQSACQFFNKQEGYIFNPRRSKWNDKLEQSIKEPEFYEQVTWELSALDVAQVIAMYFDPDTKSPISLLELGLYAASGKLVVCCPERFWRKGNVDIVCERFNIPVVEDMTRFFGKVHAKLKY